MHSAGGSANPTSAAPLLTARLHLDFDANSKYVSFYFVREAESKLISLGSPVMRSIRLADLTVTAAKFIMRRPRRRLGRESIFEEEGYNERSDFHCVRFGAESRGGARQGPRDAEGISHRARGRGRGGEGRERPDQAQPAHQSSQRRSVVGRSVGRTYRRESSSNPLIGMGIGAASGALGGKWPTRIDDDFMKEIGRRAEARDRRPLPAPPE